MEMVLLVLLGKALLMILINLLVPGQCLKDFPLDHTLFMTSVVLVIVFGNIIVALVLNYWDGMNYLVELEMFVMILMVPDKMLVLLALPIVMTLMTLEIIGDIRRLRNSRLGQLLT